MVNDINVAIDILRQGGLILYPTDTIWGIGCDAINEGAVNKIYELKRRADTKLMLVLVDNISRLEQYIQEIPEVAYELLEVADKPLTIIYPDAKNLASNLVAADGSIGIRLVKDRFCQELIKRFKRPIVSTSANLSGEKSPGVFSEIPEEIKSGVDYIVKWKQHENTPTQPSSIIKLGIGGEVKIIRT
jgi:L-threonylcarbamoyladenylate synthase